MFPLKSPGVVSVSRTHHNLHSEISSKKDNENTRARLQTVSRSTRLLTQSGRETNKINNALINHEIKYRCGTVALFFVFFVLHRSERFCCRVVFVNNRNYSENLHVAHFVETRMYKKRSGRQINKKHKFKSHCIV